MKKISLFLLGISLLFFSFTPLWAKEEASSPPVSLKAWKGERLAVSRTFEFSLTRGEWAEAQAGEIFTSGNHASDFVLPSLRETPVPIRYPRWAVREGWEGKFVIAVEVLTTGEVGRWKVIESTGHPLLDRAAARALRQWKFNPSKEYGKAIVSCIQIPILFKLDRISFDKGSGT